MRVLLVTSALHPALVGEMHRWGHAVTVEPDPVEAGKVLAREPVDVLGVEAARLAVDARWLESLRANAAPGLMVLGLAASHEEEELAPLLAAGVDEYLVAPFAPAEVKGRLTLLAQRRAASAQALAAERAAAFAALQESQALFASFMNHSPALAYMKDADGRRVWANEPYRRFYRLEGVELSNVTDRELMPDEAVAHIRQHDQEVLESGKPSTSEVMLPGPDGAAHHWLTYRFPVEDGKGQRFLGAVSLDITERKQAEAALRRSEESFRALIEGSPEAIFVHRGGPLVYVNPFTVRFLGVPASRLVGTPVLQYVHPEDREEAAGVLDAPPDRVRQGASELRFIQPNGRVMTAEVSCLSIVFQGAPATVVSARDLTDRKQMQARLVLSDRLVAMGMLAAGVAHEINQPLTFVISNLSFLANELRTLAGEVAPGRLGELEEVLREAAMGANKVRQIVAELKTFSRADDDVPTAVNLQNVIESAITIARAELRAHARVVRDYVEVPPVEGSEGRLGQVFLNLLINAAQAIPPGRPEQNEIRVTLRAVQGHVIVEIRDTGAGIPPEMRSRIFDPFFTTKPVGVGTGLGLFVCQGIITRFGGEISVESEPGRGTTFRVIFPVARGFRSGRLTPDPVPGQGDGRRV